MRRPSLTLLTPQGVAPIDYGLAIAAPLHGHIALNFVRRKRIERASAHSLLAYCPPLTLACFRPRAQVVSDYVPVAGRAVVRTGVLGLSLVTVAGLMKLNRDGPGVTATLKSLWRK